MSRTDPPMKYWMFTTNNPTEEDVPPNVWPDVEYVVWQHEQGEQGTEHLQGYVVFVGKKRLQWIKNNCCARSHFEPRNGAHEQAVAYCTKEDSRIAGDGHGPWTWGSDANIPKKKGERTDLKRVYDKLTAGASEVEIMNDPDLFPVWARYYRAIERFELLNQPKRNWITFTQVYWGTSGCGKTRRAHYEASLKADGTVGEPYYVLRKPQGSAVYWDGYQGEKHIIIDEFYGWIPRTMMQVICDRYPAIIDTKGGARNFLATKIWITSNDEPKDWWNRIGLGAMERRLTGEHGNVVHMTQPWAPPGEVPAPLPMVVPPIFPEPGPRAVIVPMLVQMERHAQAEAEEVAAYQQFMLAEEEEGRRIYDEWMQQFQ